MPPGLDVPFVFGTCFAIVVNGARYEPSGNELALSAAMMDYWSRFARTGNPAGTPAWPADDPSDAALVLDAPVTTEAAIRDADCDFWRTYYNAL